MRRSSVFCSGAFSSSRARYGRRSILREFTTIWIEKSSVLRKFWKPSVIARCSSTDLSAKLIDEQISTPRYPPSLRIMMPFRISLTGTKACVAFETGLAGILRFEIVGIPSWLLHIKRPSQFLQFPARESGSFWSHSGFGHPLHHHLLLRVFVAPQEKLGPDIIIEPRLEYLDEGL